MWTHRCGQRATNAMGPEEKWRALTIELDADGNEVWHRTDSFVFPEEPDEAAASAAEYVIRLEMDKRQASSIKTSALVSSYTTARHSIVCGCS